MQTIIAMTILISGPNFDPNPFQHLPIRIAVLQQDQTRIRCRLFHHDRRTRQRPVIRNHMPRSYAE